MDLSLIVFEIVIYIGLVHRSDILYLLEVEIGRYFVLEVLFGRLHDFGQWSLC